MDDGYGDSEADEEYGDMAPALPPTYSVKIRCKLENGQCVLENVPPEEFLYSRHAKSLEETDFFGHRRLMSVSELITMGYGPRRHRAICWWRRKRHE